MKQYETIFILGLVVLFLIGWLITCDLLRRQTDKNMDLQKENSDLIERNLKLERKLNKDK